MKLFCAPPLPFRLLSGALPLFGAVLLSGVLLLSGPALAGQGLGRLGGLWGSDMAASAILSAEPPATASEQKMLDAMFAMITMRFDVVGMRMTVQSEGQSQSASFSVVSEEENAVVLRFRKDVRIEFKDENTIIVPMSTKANYKKMVMKRMP